MTRVYYLTVSVLVLGTMVQRIAYTITEEQFKYLILLLLASITVSATKVIRSKNTKPLPKRQAWLAYSYLGFVVLLQLGRLFGLGALNEFDTYETMLATGQAVYGVWFGTILEDYLG